MCRLVIGLVSAAMLGGAALAQRGERLPQECRQEIKQLCRGAEGGFRQCLRGGGTSKLGDSCHKAIGERMGTGGVAPAAGTREFAYGSDPKQRVDLVRPVGTAKAPVLLFVHGGGWSIGADQIVQQARNRAHGIIVAYRN